MVQVKRETANICTVQDILDGLFIKTEGWNPSYFEIERGNISRANIMGVVVSLEDGGVLLDDGSGQILLRSFEGEILKDLGVGDFVVVIGRPRMYNTQKYLVPEIAKKIDPAWAEFRKLQIKSLQQKPVKKEPKEERVAVLEEEKPTNYFQKLVEYIKDLDTGQGADTDEVIRRSGINNASELIKKLIEEGEIFEIRTGKLKVLE